MSTSLYRRRFLQLASLAAVGAVLPSCGSGDSGIRYTKSDIANLTQQRLDEGLRSGMGPFGPLHFNGYRGLAELPWFALDVNGVLHNVLSSRDVIVAGTRS